MISVTKNNKPEPYHLRSISNGKAIYVGEEHVILPRGDYDYKINYETDGQLGFFDDHDELYWNVNGHAWELDFDSIVCIVHLPKGAPIKNYTAYSGHYGDREKDFEIKIIDKQTIAFSSTKNISKVRVYQLLWVGQKGLLMNLLFFPKCGENTMSIFLLH